MAAQVAIGLGWGRRWWLGCAGKPGRWPRGHGGAGVRRLDAPGEVPMGGPQIWGPSPDPAW